MSDIAVVGAGIVGLATAYAAAGAGASVSLYEPATPGSGQSTGRSRIFRHAHDDVRLVGWTARSRTIWRRWGAEFGAELLGDEGVLSLGPVAIRRLQVMDGSDVQARQVEAATVAKALPIIRPYDGPAVLDQTGGPIRARPAIEALSGALVEQFVPEEVLTLRAVGDGVEVRTLTGRRRHDHAVVCAGVRTAGLVPELTIPVRTSALVRLTFAVAGSPPARLAALQDSSEFFGPAGVYGAPYPGNTHYAVGLGASTDVAAPGGADRLADLADQARAYVRRALPGLDPDPVEHVHCWVTELPWGTDGLGVWQAPGITAVVGHNLFKQAPALGEALAGVALGEQLPADLAPAAELGAASQ